MSVAPSVVQLPFSIQRSIRRYVPHLRRAIALAVRHKMDEVGGRPLTAEEIGEAASVVIFGDGADYDLRMESQCLAAYDAGKSKALSKVIDELRASASGPPAV